MVFLYIYFRSLCYVLIVSINGYHLSDSQTFCISVVEVDKINKQKKKNTGLTSLLFAVHNIFFYFYFFKLKQKKRTQNYPYK